MAAALQNRVPAPPPPTPFAGAYIPAARGLGPRQFSNSTTTGPANQPFVGGVPDCSNFNGFRTCSSSGAYGACLSTASASVCNCVDGLEYLNCVSAAIATSTCWTTLGITDWGSYERSWVQDSCPTTPPPSFMAQLPQPATVQVDLTPVNIVTPPATAVLTTSNHVAQPSSTFAGTGQLLSQSDCSSTSYTLVKAETVVYYAAFVGCDASRPQCCPWSVSVDGSATTTGALDEGNRVAGGPGQFPIPANGIQALLNRCPDDYYSVSSQCCPNGYYKFTSRIAFQTPCFSFLKTPIKPPALTAGLAGNPTDTNLPTSAVVNMAWAMGFNVSDAAQPPLSKGAAIGVGVGAGVFGLGLIALAVFVCLRVRRNKKQALEGGAGPGQAQQPGMGQVAAAQGTMYQQGYHQAAPGSPPVSSPPLPSPPLSDGGSAGAYPFQGQYAPVPYKGHSRGYSDVSEAGWSQGSSEYPTQGYRQEGYQGYQGGQEQMQYQQAGQYGGYHRSELSGGQQ